MKNNSEGKARKRDEKHLGEFAVVSQTFGNLSQVLKEFHGKQFQALNEEQKHERVNQVLYELID